MLALKDPIKDLSHLDSLVNNKNIIVALDSYKFHTNPGPDKILY